jgi:hypothetical protein
LVTTSFAAGLNVYATVATLGLLARARVVVLPHALDAVSSWYVIGACALLFIVEFFADKIPVFDLIWNALQTFVRVPVAALLAYGSTVQLSPGAQLFSVFAAAAIAFVAHAGKTAARAVVTPTPEPFSNVALSLGEDAASVFLTWLATRHPYVAAAIALLGLGLIALVARALVRSLRKMYGGAQRAPGPTDTSANR